METTKQNYKTISFTTEMFQALLEGRKTQTRRIIKHDMCSAVMVYASEKQKNTADFISRNAPYKIGDILWVRETWQCADFEEDWDDEHIKYKICYTYKASNDLRPSGVSVEDHHGNWVNTTQERFENSSEKVEAEEVEGRDVWYPSIHMPKEAARVFLKVVHVRCEKLKDISESDAIAEGIESFENELFNETRYRDYTDGKRRDRDFDLFPDMAKHIGYSHFGGNPWPDWRCPISSFLTLWKKIFGSGSLDLNPWVWVYEFEQIEKPEGWPL